MYLLMEKQHNRGQDGVGLANIKLDIPAGRRYISRVRSVDEKPIQDVFSKVNQRFDEILDRPDLLNDVEYLKKTTPSPVNCFSDTCATEPTGKTK